MNTTLQLLTDIFSKLKRNSIFIIIAGALIAALPTYFAAKKKPIFKSYSKIFPLVAEGGDAFGSLKASIGIGGGGNSLSKYYNVNELVNSRKLARQIVTYPSKNTGHKKLYDWIIEDYNNQISWPEKKYDISKMPDSIERIIVASDILKNNTVITTQKTEFTSIECLSANENLSLRMNECILASISDFYISSKTEKARTDLYRIGELRDSLRGALNEIERAIAGFGDNSKFIVKEVAALPKMKLIRLQEEITEQYATTTMAYQNANFKLLSESPIFQVLDKPVSPVETIKESWKKKFALFFILGSLLACLFVIRKNIFSFLKNEMFGAEETIESN